MLTVMSDQISCRDASHGGVCLNTLSYTGKECVAAAAAVTAATLLALGLSAEEVTVGLVN